jgi:hypothetical protein
MRFSAARYSFCSSNLWFTSPVTYASRQAPFVVLHEAVHHRRLYSSVALNILTLRAGTLANSTQTEICEVVRFLVDKGAKLDEEDGRGRTPINIADRLPIDKAVNLLTELIIQSGATPKVTTRR